MILWSTTKYAGGVVTHVEQGTSHAFPNTFHVFSSWTPLSIRDRCLESSIENTEVRQGQDT